MKFSEATGESPTHRPGEPSDVETPATQEQRPGSLALDADMMNVSEDEDNDDGQQVVVNPNILMELNPKMAEMWPRGRLNDYESTRILEMIVEYYYMRFGIFDPFMVATLLVAMSIGRNGEARKEFVSVASAMAGASQAPPPTPNGESERKGRGFLSRMVLGGE